MLRRHLVLTLFTASVFWESAALADSNSGPQPQFFPKGILSDNAKADGLLRDWYSKQLIALQETSLYPPTTNTEIYRFTWLRSFNNPMVFKITVLENGSGSLLVKRGGGKGGYDPGPMDLKKEISLTRMQVDNLKSQLDKMSYWQKPTEMRVDGLDGAQWIVEAIAGDKYKIVDRWSDTDPDIQAWGLELITLSGIEVGDIY